MGRKSSKRHAQQQCLDRHCMFCDRRYNSEHQVEKHQQKVHFKCPECFRTFRHTKSLSTHMQTVHRLALRTVPGCTVPERLNDVNSVRSGSVERRRHDTAAAIRVSFEAAAPPRCVGCGTAQKAFGQYCFLCTQAADQRAARTHQTFKHCLRCGDRTACRDGAAPLCSDCMGERQPGWSAAPSYRPQLARRKAAVATVTAATACHLDRRWASATPPCNTTLPADSYVPQLGTVATELSVPLHPNALAASVQISRVERRNSSWPTIAAPADGAPLIATAPADGAPLIATAEVDGAPLIAGAPVIARATVDAATVVDAGLPAATAEPTGELSGTPKRPDAALQTIAQSLRSMRIRVRAAIQLAALHNAPDDFESEGNILLGRLTDTDAVAALQRQTTAYQARLKAWIERGKPCRTARKRAAEWLLSHRRSRSPIPPRREPIQARTRRTGMGRMRGRSPARTRRTGMGRVRGRSPARRGPRPSSSSRSRSQRRRRRSRSSSSSRSPARRSTVFPGSSVVHRTAASRAALKRHKFSVSRFPTGVQPIAVLEFIVGVLLHNGVTRCGITNVEAWEGGAFVVTCASTEEAVATATILGRSQCLGQLLSVHMPSTTLDVDSARRMMYSGIMR